MLLDIPFVAHVDDAIITAEYSIDLTHWTLGELVQTNNTLRSFDPPVAMHHARRLFARAAVRMTQLTRNPTGLQWLTDRIPSPCRHSDSSKVRRASF